MSDDTYTRVDLANGGPEDLRKFCLAVIDLAIAHETGGTVRERAWSGADLVREFTYDARGFHRLMASGLYNKTRDTARCWGRAD